MNNRERDRLMITAALQQHGAWLKQKREEAGLTRRELADRVNDRISDVLREMREETEAEYPGARVVGVFNGPRECHVTDVALWERDGFPVVGDVARILPYVAHVLGVTLDEFDDAIPLG
jgi:transcriptional regulator with XRE-family HTH domain